MPLSVKSYVLTAGAATTAAIFDALIAHFTTAPGFWQLKPGATNSLASQAFVITQKTSPTHDINFRLVSATVTNVVVDPGKGITNCGSSGAIPTGLTTQAGPSNINFTEATAVAPGVYVIELQEACYILTWNTTYTLCPRVMGGGNGIQLFDSGNAALGIDGSFVMNGGAAFFVATSSTILGNSNTNTGSATQVRLSQAYWGGLNGLSYGTITSMSIMNNGTTNDLVLNAVPVAGVNTTHGNRIIGVTKHLFVAPYRAGVILGQLPRTILQTANENWLYINNSAAPSQYLICWEPGVVPSKP